MRPLGSTKQRMPIYKEEFEKLILLTKRDKELNQSTKFKLLRAYTLLYLTGCRVSEIIDFTYTDVVTITCAKKISLSNNTKTKKPRALFFNQTGVALLSDVPYKDIPNLFEGELEGVNPAYLFYANGKEYPMSKSKLTTLLNKYLAKHLGELYTTHSFRAGYITRIVEATGNIKTASDLVGHSSIKTTMGYLHTTTDQKQEAINKVF